MGSAPLKLGELAERLGAELIGDPDCLVGSLASLESARQGQLSFIAQTAYQRFLTSTEASAVILAPELVSAFRGNKLVVAQPYQAYAHASAFFAPTESTDQQGIHPTAIIGPDCDLAEDVNLGPNAVLGRGVVLGQGVTLGPGVVVGDHCVLGSGCRLMAQVVLYRSVVMGVNCLIHSGAVLGADGFGFAPGEQGWIKIHQLGGVVLGDNVEIGAGTTIDRGALDDTRIASGVKIDNQVQVAHNVSIGQNTAIAGQAGIAGSARIGDNCTLAGGVGVVGHVRIGNNVHVTGMSMVSRSIEGPGTYSSGTPLTRTAEWRKNAVRFRQLDTLAARLKKLEQENDPPS